MVITKFFRFSWPESYEIQNRIQEIIDLNLLKFGLLPYLDFPFE